MRGVQRITLVLITTSLFFLTLTIAGRAAWLPLNQPTADLSIVKSDANPNVRPGGTLTYRLFYENSGTATATAVVIIDTLPAHTTHLYDNAGSQGWTTTISGTAVIWQRDVLTPSVSGAFDVVLRVSDDAPAGASLVNHVEIATATEEENTANNTWTTQPTVVRVADVQVTKTGPAEVGSGDRITYTIQYSNAGSEPADEVIITDTLPVGVTYLESSGDIGAPPTVDGRQVIWQAGSLQPASGGGLTLVAQVSPDQPSYTVLTNTVTISTQTPERDRTDNLASSTAVVRAGAPYSIQVSVAATVAAGTTLPLSAQVLDRWSNPVADGTVISFTSSPLVSVEPTAVTVGGIATTTLSAGTQVGMAVIVATAGTAIGTAEVEVTPGPVHELNLTTIQSTQTVGKPVGLRAGVYDEYGNPIGAGMPVSFTTTLGEVQPPAATTDATGIVTATLTTTRTGTALVSAHTAGLEDSATVLFTPGPPEQVTVTADPPAIPVDGATSRILATLTDRYGNRVGDGIAVAFASSLGTLQPMTATTIAGQATTVLTSGSVHGQAAVTATVGTYTGTTTVEFLPADLRIESTHTPKGEILPGTPVTYTITFENAGQALARNVVITDVLPVGFVDTSFESSGASISLRENTSYIWDVEDLSPGEGGTIILRGRFDRHRLWPSSQFVANVARIGSATAEGNPDDNTTSAGNLIITANMYVQSIVDEAGTELKPGQKIRYRIFLGNYGPAPAQGFTITDTLPAHTSLWQETSHQIPGLTRVSDDEAVVQVWRYDGVVTGPNFGNFYVWLNIDETAPGGAMLRNRVELHTDTPESDYTDNTQVIERRLSGVNLAARLRGPATVVPGRSITYTLRYTNTGTLAAEDVVLTQGLPPGVSLLEASRPPVDPQPGRIEWDLGTVVAGQWGQITVVGQVETSVRAGQTLRSTLNIATSSVESFTGDNASTWETRVVPDAPYRLTLEMEPTTVTVGTVHPLQVDVADQFDNPIDGVTVTLTTTIGIVTPTLPTTVLGVVTATFTAPLSPGQGIITATLDGLSDAVTVTVEPGPPSELRLEADELSLPADGQSSTAIRAYVQDAYGNPVKDSTAVTFGTDRGVLSNGQSHHTVSTVDGRASTVLQSVRTPGPAHVVASAGPASAEIVIEFTPLPQHHIYLPLISVQARGEGQ